MNKIIKLLQLLYKSGKDGNQYGKYEIKIKEEIKRYTSKKEIIDQLGEWLCKDMQKDLVAKGGYDTGLPSTEYFNKVGLVKEVAERIKFYRDNY